MNRPKERHGLTKTPTYYAWVSMLQRCTNPNHRAWPSYGGRGITVCKRWLNSFSKFLADMGEKPEGLTLERIKNGKGYSPSNCRWATVSEQNANKRSWRARSFGPLDQLTQTQMRELAARAGTTYDSLRHVQAGRRKLSSEAAIRVEKAALKLGLDIRREKMSAGCATCEFAKACRSKKKPA